MSRSGTSSPDEFLFTVPKGELRHHVTKGECIPVKSYCIVTRVDRLAGCPSTVELTAANHPIRFILFRENALITFFLFSNVFLNFRPTKIYDI